MYEGKILPDISLNLSQCRMRAKHRVLTDEMTSPRAQR